jgi:hypothetical protein
MPIAVTVTAKILVLRIRDEIVAMSQRFRYPAAGLIRILGEKDRRTIRLKIIFCRHWLMPPLIDPHPSIRRQRGLKATIAATIWEKF